MDVLERRTQEIGRELLRRVRQTSDFDDALNSLQDRWIGKMLRDPLLKTALFRLVDVLPALRTPRQVNQHLKEYLGRGRLAPILKFLPDRAAGTVAGLAVHRMARRFIAAEGTKDAARAVQLLRDQKLTCTIDLLGEAVLSESEAEDYARQYHDLVDTLSDSLTSAPPVEQIDHSPIGPIPRVNVSIKLSSLYSQFDPVDSAGTIAAVAGRLRPILSHARRRGAFVCFDMEQFAFKDLTIRAFKEILLEPEFHDWPDVGIAMQAYLVSTKADLRDLNEWARRRNTPVCIRLVKGAYWDVECVTAVQNNWPIPVYVSKSQTDAAYELLTEFLIANCQHLRPAFASHNLRSIAHALALAEQFRLPPRLIEFQLLKGMAPSIQSVLVELGQRTRLYAPVGKLLPGMSYLVRRLLENTSNESFLRAALQDDAPAEELLMNPANHVATLPQPTNTSDFRNEPPTDFNQPAHQASMRRALANYSTNNQRPLVIAGKRIATTEWIESINPSHKRSIIGSSARATADHARQAIAAAKQAFDHWRDESASTRSNLLLRVADVLRQRRFELAALETLECGKPWREADADVAEAIDFCVYYARQALRLAEDRHSDLPGETNVQFYEPRGVAVVIAPWNFPLAILCGMTAAAVVTGNTVVMKPAEQSSLIAAELMNAFERAAAPPGVVNYLPGIGEEIGPVLVSSPDVALIAFTGSRQVGLSIQQSAAQTPPGQNHLKRVISEMGGKNAIIIDTDADADADEAIRGIIASAFGYAGQKCSACSRLILPNEIHDPFVARLIEAVKSIRVAPAKDPACFVGPVIDAGAYARIQRALEKGKHEANLAHATNVDSLSDEGFYVGPHVFTDVDPTTSLAQDEIFGPVLAVLRATDLNHAIELANNVPYALTGGFYSRSPANVELVRKRFRVGDLYVNRKITGALVGRQPFGGFKLSGIGSQAGGPDYLLQFLLPRVVTENTLRHGFVAD